MAQGSDTRIERLETIEWRSGETVVDVGGGNGSLLAELLKAYPDLRGIVFDLPETTRDESLFGEIAIAALAPHVAGDNSDAAVGRES